MAQMNAKLCESVRLEREYLSLAEAYCSFCMSLLSLREQILVQANKMRRSTVILKEARCTRLDFPSILVIAVLINLKERRSCDACSRVMIRGRGS